MIAWSPEALDFFRRRCEVRRPSLLAVGADPDEVFSDWKSIVESRAADAGSSSVSLEVAQAELDSILSAADASPSAAPVDFPPVSSAFPPAMRVFFRRFNTSVLWIFGVALPLGVLLFELVVGLCAEVLFDPLSTWLHVLLVALVPAANALALLAAARARGNADFPRLHRRAALFNGLAIGVSAFYALQFAVVTPFAAMAVIYFGLGLIPLAPLLSLLCAAAARARLRRVRFLSDAPAISPLWRSALPAFALLLVLEIPRAVVLCNAELANDSDPAVRLPAVRLIRAIGDRDVLLRRCYRSGETIDLASLAYFRLFGCNPSREDAQNAYYRVVGTPYNAVRPPRIKGLRGRPLLDDDWFDPALGGDQVAARVKGLSLSQSRLDGRIDSASGVAYLEWTLEFRNSSQTDREARALVDLPPGAVVSRVTLWIDDEPREAAFGGRSQTRQAYQQVAVRQRRDPVLVTTAGPDRVLLQCFPVPAGRSMKTRIGISAPLLVPDSAEARAALRLPCFAEQNFSAASNLATSAWIESDAPVSAPASLQSFEHNSAFAVRGRLPADSSAPPVALRLPLAMPLPPVVARDPRLPEGHSVLQSLLAPSAEPEFPPALAIVLDGSARMKPHHDFLVKCVFDLIPQDTKLRTFVARDVVDDFDGKPPSSIRYVGGCDNGPALAMAAEWSLANGNAPILWLHAAQPIDSSDLESLRQSAEFSRGNLRVFSRQFGPGANRIAEALSDLSVVHPLPVPGDGSFEILDFLSGKSARWQRLLVPADSISPDVAEGSSHVARLWAADEISILSSPALKSGREKALDLARSFQLVTPVSGAVVLETAAQYSANNLTPVDPSSTPGIVPEPGTLALLLLGAPALAALRRLRKRC